MGLSLCQSNNQEVVSCLAGYVGVLCLVAGLMSPCPTALLLVVAGTACCASHCMTGVVHSVGLLDFYQERSLSWD
jgi:hypothetical protein